MSIVQPWLPDARVLDLFAGSGALGLEALSRGAASADFVDLGSPSIAAIRANAESLGAGHAARIHRGDAFQFVERLADGAYDVAFADPPYDLGLAARLADRWLQAPFSALLAIEHRANEALPEPGERRRYGGTAISIFRAAHLAKTPTD